MACMLYRCLMEVSKVTSAIAMSASVASELNNSRVTIKLINHKSAFSSREYPEQTWE